MFEWVKKTAPADFSDFRELFFGDVPLSDWKPQDASAQTQEPWLAFQAARDALAGNDVNRAVAALRRIVDTPSLESRQYLEAWHALRQLGIQPQRENEAKCVLGVVLEVHLDDGLDTLAAYADGTARYINHGGRVIIWENSDTGVAGLVDDLLRAGQRVAELIGPWEEPRRAPPPKRHVRINMLTASGLHFGEGPLTALSADSMAGPVIAAGTVLMKSLIDRAQTPSS
jgi:hypothetical protein